MLTLPNGFVVFNAFAALESLQDQLFFFLVVGWNQNGNRLADDFFGQIAKNALRAAVPARDDTIEGLADDCVVA